jgi:hypothetical protein
MKTVSTSHSQAQGYGVFRGCRCSASWWTADVYGNSLQGARECADEYAHEFGGEVKPIKREVQACYVGLPKIRFNNAGDFKHGNKN